jgi:hypothetical protein
VADEERRLLETTARTVLKLKEDISDRVTGIETVPFVLFLAHGRTDIALARLRVQADFLKMNRQKTEPKRTSGPDTAACYAV